MSRIIKNPWFNRLVLRRRYIKSEYKRQALV